MLQICFCAHHSKEEWKSRSIYQILTDRFAKEGEDIKMDCDLSNYCGGTFKGIQEKLDYISGMGFDAIWISPILKNKEGSYHGYHNIDLYSINEHFGTSNDLKDLIKACHKKNIWVILDAVPNHMAPDVPVSSYFPFNKDEYFHDACDIIQEDDQDQKEKCRLFGLPDLKQENEFVKNTYLDWIRDTIDKYGFDGVRYADVPYVPKWFWGEFTEAAGTYTFGIVSSKDPNYISDYQKYMDGVGNYPLFYTTRECFCGSLKKLEEYYINSHKYYHEPAYNVNWVDNHDNPRFLNSCNDKRLFRNAIIFNFFYEGIPIFYYGDEQYFNGGNDPNNRETMFGYHYTNSDLYQIVKIANEVRKSEKTYDEKFVQRYSDDYFYAYTRGNVLIAVTNLKEIKRIISYHDFNEGDKLCNKLRERDCINVIDGKITIRMEGEPKIYVKESFTNL
jgi:alpha-amylase